MTFEVRRAPSPIVSLIDACRNDFGRLAFDGFGIMLSDQQLEAYQAIGQPGPRQQGEAKVNWLSGGTRSGKTVFAFLTHADCGLYKRGVDRTDPRYWRNYLYQTLAIAPTEELTLRLWGIADSIAKGANDAQYDRKARRSRGGAFLGKIAVGTAGRWGIIRYATGAETNFRSSEGKATRLEGGQWWWITWDEWASQADREIEAVLTDVLLARARDHDAKIMPMAWPKPETEHHLIQRMRRIEEGVDRDSKVVFMSAADAYFTNAEALEVEKRQKDPATWKRTVLGQPAGGAAVEFKQHLVTNLFRHDLKLAEPPQHGFDYFNSWDIGLAHDATVGLTWRIPIVGGKRIVTPEYKARIVDVVHLEGGADLTPERITSAVQKQQAYYRAQSALDATSMGGMMAYRSVKDMKPRPQAFSSRANDRLWGNMRLAAITNGLDCLEWGRPQDPDSPEPWGLFEAPWIIRLNDQMLWFDRDEADRPDDWVWSFLIGAWYIRRWWAQGEPGKRVIHVPRSFDVRSTQRTEDGSMGGRRRRGILLPPGVSAPEGGQVFIRDGKRWVPPVPAAKRG